MASIIKRNGRYQVRVRRRGSNTICKTFSLRGDAVRWAIKTERSVETGAVAIQDTAMLEILDRYENDVSRQKKACSVERYRIQTIRKSELALKTIRTVSASDIAAYRDERLRFVQPASVQRELSVLSHIFTMAIKEWGYELPSNPVLRIRKPPPSKPRTRRLQEGEEQRLFDALAKHGNVWVVPIVRLAIETAMRRGELLSLRWEHVHLDQRFVHLPDTKNGDSRDVPLSQEAVATLTKLPRDISGSVFPIHFEGLKTLWRRASDKAGIEDLHFHDLRHEATSRFFEKGLNVMEVAAITGHKDLRMLQRYTHLRAEDLARKLG